MRITTAIREKSTRDLLRYALGLVRGMTVKAQFPRFADVPVITGKAPRIQTRGTLEVGKRFRADSRIFRSHIAVDPNASLIFGDDVFVNQGVRIHSRRAVRIGSRVEIGDLVVIYDTNFHAVIPGEEVKTEPVTIDDDVWLCASSIILPGVHIGRGSVVAAGAVVTKSFPAGSLIAGNPATVVRSFDVDTHYKRRGR